MRTTLGVLVVVGGTSGIGAAIARLWSSAGGVVVALGLETPQAQPPHCAESEVVFGDARDPVLVDQVIDKAWQLAQRLNLPLVGCVHVAGGSGRSMGDGPLDQISDSGWAGTLSLNLDTVFYSNRAIVRRLLEQGKGGAIVNISSVLAVHPASQHFATHAYATAKAAIIGLTTACASYYAAHDIRFNAILPGLIDTPMAARAMSNPGIQAYLKSKQPLCGGGAGEADAIANAALWLVSPEARWITGQALCVDGGWSVSESSISPP